MSKESKVVFVALTQHCIQSNATHVKRVESVLCIQWPLTPARREGYLSLLSWGLAVHHWSVRGGTFFKFLGLVNYKGDCRQDAQPIPKS